ncbi:hypothetical protein AALO_G00123000 [Alosa alosa]|uniref:Uncharacterized protein n=1 Tax=Alosa alosa TaxID=278164 RepID=A0AAV6GQK8_9TELE|nr:uncharacterized protein LOC125301119 [Alosa alosa]KAG5275647.1 hypothetical protein AALO_G00123000 [Alosa alosa]
MWFCWFFACCLAARQDEHGSDTTIKKRVKKYKLEDLKRELKASGVNVDMDMDENQKNPKKKTKKELQKLLIRELKLVEHGRIRLDKKARERAEGLTLPMEIPEDVVIVLNDLDTYLDKQLEESEINEQREDDIQLVMKNLLDQVEMNSADRKELEITERQREEGVKVELDSFLDKVDSTLTSEGLKEEGEKVSVLRPEAGDWKKAEREAHFWGARGNHKGSIPIKGFRVASNSSRWQTL